MNETYIKMCREAVEIQELWEPKSGDMIIRTHSIFGEQIDKQIWDSMDSISILVREIGMEDNWWSGTNKEGGSICLKGDEFYTKTCQWLPRQEDLQDLCANEVTRGAEGLIRKIASFTEQNHAIPMFSRSEQITAQWLRYTMQLLFNKKWDSIEEKWVEI